MNYDPLTIATGILLLFIFSYVLITAFNFIFMGAIGEGHKVKAMKMFLSSAVVTLAWVASTLVAIMFASSSGAIFFSIAALILIFGTNFFLVEKMIGISGKNKIIYCLILAIILNPGWLTFTRLI